MQGNGSLTVLFTGGVMNGTGLLRFVEVMPGEATMTGTGGLLAAYTQAAVANGMLAALQMSGGDINYAYSRDQYLAPLYGYAAGGEYVPPPPAMGFGLLPPFVSFGHAPNLDGQTIGMIHAVLAQGGDYNYAVGEANLEPLFSIGIYDDPTYATAYGLAVAIGEASSLMEHVVFVNSSGTIVDSISGAKELIGQFLESLTYSESHTILGDFLATADSTASALFMSAGGIDSRAAVDQTARVWVVNVDTGATSQYDGYGFNSFFSHDGKYYGVAEDGIYLLEGDNDAGQDIDALVDFGKSSLGTAQQKRVPNVYAGVSSSGKLLLKVSADGQEYIYEARSSSAEMKNHRFDIGKGLKGNYFQFTLMNRFGDDFEIEGISFEPITLPRKI